MNGLGEKSMASVYTGYGVDKYRAARLNAKRRSRRLGAATLIKILSLVVMLTFALTYLIIGVARSINARNELDTNLAYRNSVLNSINKIDFEIRRETQFDNLAFKARNCLGMIIPAESLTANATDK